MNRRKTRKQKVYITRDMIPAARILVYYIRHDGEIVADAITFPVSDIFENKVCLKTLILEYTNLFLRCHIIFKNH